MPIKYAVSIMSVSAATSWFADANTGQSTDHLPEEPTKYAAATPSTDATTRFRKMGSLGPNNSAVMNRVTRTVVSSVVMTNVLSIVMPTSVPMLAVRNGAVKDP